MPDPQCALAGCSRPSPDAAVCTGCAAAVSAGIRGTAELWPELETTVARQGRSGDPTPRAGRPAPAQPIRPGLGDPADDQQAGWPSGLPVDLAASEAADAVRNTVTTWARVIAEETGADVPTTMPALLRWLAGRAEWIRHQAWAAEALDELGEVPRMVRRAVDRIHPERRYLGPCACLTDLHARHGAANVVCPGCGTEHRVDTILRRLEAEVRARSYTAAEIEDAYGIRADRIRQWASRGRIAQRGHDRLGRPLYALPEVLALARRARAAA